MRMVCGHKQTSTKTLNDTYGNDSNDELSIGRCDSGLRLHDYPDWKLHELRTSISCAYSALIVERQCSRHSLFYLETLQNPLRPLKVVRINSCFWSRKAYL